MAVTPGGFEPSLTGTTTVTGSISNTLSEFSSGINGTTTVDGSVSSVLDAFSPSIQGTTTVSGSVSNTLDSFTSNITGLVGGIDGAISVSLGSFVSNITGTNAAPAATRRDGGSRKVRSGKKRTFLIQDELYEQRTKITAEVTDSVHPPVKPEKVKPGQIKPATIRDIKPAVSLIVTDDDVELVMMVLDALDEAA